MNEEHQDEWVMEIHMGHEEVKNDSITMYDYAIQTWAWFSCKTSEGTGISTDIES